jgi:DNA polymerase III delta prime subunit
LIFPENQSYFINNIKNNNNNNRGKTMKAIMGYNNSEALKGKKVPVTWDSKLLINSHLLLMGKSGTGKTYTLRKIIEQISEEAKRNGKEFRCHVMDVHGDIEISNCSTVKFSEATNYGFNPLVINPDPDFGGVRKRIESFVRNINRSGRTLGDKQAATLRNILYDLYQANGFYADDPESWKTKGGKNPNKKMPNLSDALRFARAKVKATYLGTSSKAISKSSTRYAT